MKTRPSNKNQTSQVWWLCGNILRSELPCQKPGLHIFSLVCYTGQKELWTGKDNTSCLLYNDPSKWSRRIPHLVMLSQERTFSCIGEHIQRNLKIWAQTYWRIPSALTDDSQTKGPRESRWTVIKNKKKKKENQQKTKWKQWLWKRTSERFAQREENIWLRVKREVVSSGQKNKTTLLKRVLKKKEENFKKM